MPDGKHHRVAQFGFTLLLRQGVIVSQLGNYLLERDSNIEKQRSSGQTCSLMA
jgi:hypothetical protein